MYGPKIMRGKQTILNARVNTGLNTRRNENLDCFLDLLQTVTSDSSGLCAAFIPSRLIFFRRVGFTKVRASLSNMPINKCPSKPLWGLYWLLPLQGNQECRGMLESFWLSFLWQFKKSGSVLYIFAY